MADATLPVPYWDVPSTVGPPFHIDAVPGGLTVVVGANGAGKSALAQWLGGNHGSTWTVNRIFAHRKLWLASPASTLTGADSFHQRQNVSNWGNSHDARWRDHGTDVKPNLVLYDLVAKENASNAAIAKLAREGAATPEAIAALPDSPLQQLNRCVAAPLGFSIAVLGDGTLAGLRNATSSVPLSSMSDGEKAAVLLSADVIVAAPNSIQIIDEPERHLHRSVSAAVIRALLDERPDCHLVVLSHDLDLVRALAGRGRTLVTSGCSWGPEGLPTAWELHELPAGDEVPEDVRRAVLGGRARVLFVEGATTSVDLETYRLLFPGWEVRPSGGCVNVRRNVSGLRETGSLHWISVWGIVDIDDRQPAEVAEWEAAGVRCMPLREVENVYYIEPILAAIAEDVAKTHTGATPAQILDSMRAAALAGLLPNVLDHLALRSADAGCRAALRRQFESLPPITPTTPTISFAATPDFAGERQRLEQLKADSDLARIVERYSIRDTSIPARIAQAAHIPSASDYRLHVRRLLRESDALRQQVAAVVATLPV